MTISSIPSNTASAITPFNPLGKHTVGEEEKDSKNSSFKAVEESSQSSRTASRQEGESKDDKVEALKEDAKERGGNKEEKERQEKREQAQDQKDIRTLAARDREVRNHERAHSAVGGQYAGAPSYQFKRGPDGVNYAVSGEVSIETGAVGNDPQATINKAQQIRRAALAPADPSPQDRRVAASAVQLELQAREDLSDIRRQEAEQKKRESEQRLQEQQKQTTEKDARNSNTPLDQNRGGVDQKDSAKTDLQTNRRILELNRNYSDFVNQSSRLGSIVSEAV